MSIVNIVNVDVLDNPNNFNAPMSFNITFQSMTALSDDLEWKLLYVGSPKNNEHDQELESILVGPIDNPGSYSFHFEVPAPNAARIPADDLLGVTILMLFCSYRGQEFLKVGYYVNNLYPEEKKLEGGPVKLEFIERTILTKNPRIIKTPIEWSSA